MNMFIEPTLTTWMHKALTRQEARQPTAILTEVTDVVIQEPVSMDNNSQAEVVIQFVGEASSRRVRSRPDGTLRLDGQNVAVYDDQGRDLNGLKHFAPCEEASVNVERFH